MWKIKTINNGSHAITMVHPDGEKMDLIIPVEHRVSNAAKMTWLKVQTDLRDVIKEAEATKALAAAVVITEVKKPLVLYAIIAIQAVAIVCLLIKVL